MGTATELPSCAVGVGAPARQGAALAYGFGALGGLLFGYDIGVIGGALLFIRKAMDLTPLMQGVVVSSILVGALIGAGVSGQVVDRFGPRRLLMLSGVLLTLGSGGAALSTGPAMLVAFRVLTGLGVGAASVQVPLYLSELAPTRARGGLTTLNQLMISLGIFVAYLVDYGLAGTGAWRVMIGLAMIPSVLLLVGMWSQPDSPRWLARQGRSAEAHAVLVRTRTAAEADSELADMHVAARARRSGLGERWSDPGFRRPLLLACALAVLQQVIGINTIIYYAPTIFSAAGFKSSAAILVAVGLGALTLATTLVTSQIIDRVGRRPLMLGGALAMAVCMTVLGIIFLQGALRGETVIVLAILCIAAYKISFSLSWGPIVWVLLPEVLPLNGRGPGMGVAATLNWVANFVVALTFPIMLAVGAGAIFLIFAGFAIVAFIVALRMLHETSGRSLEQIELAGSFSATH
jgi:sugar porter (SP) family MFS transporter